MSRSTDNRSLHLDGDTKFGSPKIEVICDALIQQSLETEKYQRKFQPEEYGEIPSLLLSFNSLVKISNLTGFIGLKKLCLDNNNIEVIEGLDACVNLEWLDLSFNRIKKIEGLSKLVNLTDLALQSNQIEKIEGMDSLKKLHCLSAGDNKIATLDNLLYLRQFTALKLVSFSGNPVASDPEYKSYAISHVPSLDFLDYRRILKKERDAALEQYQAEILELEEKETIETSKSDAARREEAAKQRDTAMNIPGVRSLFNTVVMNDPDSTKMLVVPDFKEFVTAYRDEAKEEVDSFVAKMGEQFEVKARELAEFHTVMDALNAEAAHTSRMMIRAFEVGLNEARTQLADKAVARDSKKCQGIADSVEDAALSMEAELLDRETERQEQADEHLRTFEGIANDITNASLEHIQLFFSNWREIETKFFENTLTTGQALLEELASGEQRFTRYPEAARALLKDRVAFNTIIQGAHDNRGTIIDQAEDDLMAGERAWIKEHVGGARADEDTRNRVRVSEVFDYVRRVEEEMDEV
ncbi:Leucine-rich repeat [Carpediemonas membranifera]|uniref:Dynein regulatory complex subunit 3 n=1 Tax=Carpediemonas membranifera TaxID=201153 RepID=A0A8J6AS32_9EUKA|nr:Leucine-rich repeat [Carpediemonas membranifera]|eukprot:KAG9392638.1 Leucine-rich repeat [Carpediemonas membranifera]